MFCLRSEIVWVSMSIFRVLSQKAPAFGDFLRKAEKFLIGHQATAVGFVVFTHKNGNNQLHLYFLILASIFGVFQSDSVKYVRRIHEARLLYTFLPVLIIDLSEARTRH